MQASIVAGWLSVAALIVSFGCTESSGSVPDAGNGVEETPDVLTCASPLATACSPVAISHNDAIPCLPVWSDAGCAFSSPCGGYLGMIANNHVGDCRTFCFYDPSTKALVALSAYGVDTPPECWIGSGTVPTSCMDSWLTACETGSCQLAPAPADQLYCAAQDAGQLVDATTD